MARVAILDDYQGALPSDPAWSCLRERVRLEVFRDTLHDEAALARRLAPFEILVAIRERTRFSAGLLTRLPALRHLALTGRNSGQADVAAATACGILVTETEGSGAGAVELTMALMLAVVRRLPREERSLRAGGWQAGVGVELRGKTLGILGLGRIGSRIAAFGALLGMRVLAWGPTLTAERAAAAGVTLVSLETLFRESDLVSLHLRLSEGTRGLIRAEHLALMKPTAYLINTARGPLVEEAALVAALRAERIAGAALDVYDVEPLPAGHPLLALENVVLTPHIGFVTRESYAGFSRQVVECIEAVLAGRLPPRCLNPEAATRR
jgi:phosphoglycerate dehydrogenase-like enzyme